MHTVLHRVKIHRLLRASLGLFALIQGEEAVSAVQVFYQFVFTTVRAGELPCRAINQESPNALHLCTELQNPFSVCCAMSLFLMHPDAAFKGVSLCFIRGQVTLLVCKSLICLTCLKMSEENLNNKLIKQSEQSMNNQFIYAGENRREM